MKDKTIKMPNKKLKDYNENDIFWKDFVNIPNNPYRLETELEGFKCLLISPTRKDDLSGKYYPTPLGHMASLVRMNKGKARILVEDFEIYNPKKFSDYDLICFYPIVASLSKMMDFSVKIKKDQPNTKICFFNSDQHQHEMLLCNPKAKDFARKIMERCPSLDHILVGEAESSFIRLCETLKKHEDTFRNIPSCLYRERGDIKLSQKPIEPVNFKFLPFPARDYLETTFDSNGINTSSPRIQASRGCVSPCTYCDESFTNIIEDGRKRPIILRDISKLVDEIEMLQKTYGAIFFNSIDSSFEDPGKKGIKRMTEFCDEIERRGIEASFKIHIRSETAEQLDNDFLRRLKYVGIDIIGTGIESGLEKELKSYRKIATPEQSKKGLRKMMDENFFIILGYIMFSPILELGDLPEKAAFLKELHYGWDYLSWSNNIIVYPGTAYHSYIQKRGLEIEHDELAGRIPYCFEDEKVGKIANVMGNLKVRFPEIMQLHQSLYDSMNILSRYNNKMNQHLKENGEEAFREFEKTLDSQISETERVYSSFFLDLIDSNLSETEEELLYRKYNFQGFLLRTRSETRQNINNFIAGFKEKGLSTNKLVLKSWFSIKDSQNTSGGKNE